MMDKENAKEKIKEAALDLFYFQGYKGTTTRQIADKAKTNLALISYYFGGKKGLVETIMIQFYEEYFKQLEASLKMADAEQKQRERLWVIISSAFDYLAAQYKMTRFIYRELSLDSMLIREVMTTYLTKEKFFFQTLFNELKKVGELPSNSDLDMIVLQLLNLLYMPFLQHQVIREVYYQEPLQEEFKERYLAQLKSWFTSIAG